MVPQPDKDLTDDLPSILCRCGRNCIIDLGQQLENGLDPHIGKRCISIFDLTKECIGQHDLQNRLEDVAGAIIFLFDQLRHRRHILVLVIPHHGQIITEYTRELGKHPAFNIAVFQHICDKERDVHGKLHIARICLYIFPEVFLVLCICSILQHWRCRVPFVCG